MFLRQVSFLMLLVKNYQNRPMFDRVIQKIKIAHFYARPSRPGTVPRPGEKKISGFYHMIA